MEHPSQSENKNIQKKFMKLVNEYFEPFFDKEDGYMIDIITPLGIKEENGIITFPDGSRFKIGLIKLK